MSNRSTDTKLTADYLVIGSGAMGMAFADVLMTETEATVVMVDKHHRPGGHWNDAYPYVRLHQPFRLGAGGSAEAAPAMQDALRRLAASLEPATANLQRLLAESA